jgi:hypothetical protein
VYALRDNMKKVQLSTLTREEHEKNVADLREATRDRTPIFGVRLTELASGYVHEIHWLVTERYSVRWKIFAEQTILEPGSIVLVEDEPDAIDQSWNSPAWFRVLSTWDEISDFDGKLHVETRGFLIPCFPGGGVKCQAEPIDDDFGAIRRNAGIRGVTVRRDGSTQGHT